MTSNLKTIKELSPILNCAEITIRRLIAARKIPYHKIGYRYLFSEEDIREYLNHIKVNPIAVGEGKS